jgi:gamma-glutamyltranspeptidase/glutathione hydrolase
MLRSIVLAAALVLALAALPAHATEGPRFHPAVTSPTAVIATESPAAARIGRQVLAEGGNAVDAAAATVFALNVARPQSCGIGGGGFMLYRSHTGAVRALDFRETAPASIRADQFADASTNGSAKLYSAFTGHTTVGVPGVVAGMDAALARYGTLTLGQAISRAEALASLGVRVTRTFSRGIEESADRFRRYPAAAALFLPGDKPLQAGSTFVQPKLAADFRRIMRGGRDAFYKGTIARRIVAEMQGFQHPEIGDQGLLTMDDFANYRAVWRTPLIGTYQGSEVAVMPPPTSGGVATLEMLNLLEPLGLKSYGPDSTNAIQLIGEAQRIAWADRNQYLADPDVVPQPTDKLISKTYADRRRGEMSLTRTSAKPAGDVTDEPGSTTHLSVVDREGNAVALTCTIEQEYGSAVVAPGTGFLLNNELTDFTGPGTANQPAPGKRPRSSMDPAIVTRGGKPILVTGAAGGSRIIVGVFSAIFNMLEFGMDAPHALDAPRADNQGASLLRLEDARLDPTVVHDLEGRGWQILAQGTYARINTRVQAAGVLGDGRRYAVSDPRSDDGSLAVKP